MTEQVISELWTSDNRTENQHHLEIEVDLRSFEDNVVSNGVQLDLIEVCYNVLIKKKVRHLLHNINFHLDPGEMCALMGPSGAGKSTLLDLIANRKRNGMWSGEILINQLPRSHLFNRDSAYVLQDDVHIATFTVEETIKYAAWTRMPEETTESEKIARVIQLLDIMRLTHVKDSIVGDAMTKGISGGQLKRLSIAVEIVALPNLIFLDEPTSGLDSSISLEVMSAVRGLADQGRTCVSTIHQPSPEVFALFDRVALVCGGRLVYSGPAVEAVAYFTSPALGYDYDKNQNPAQFIMEVCGGSIHPNNLNGPRQPEQLQEIFSRSSFAQKHIEQLHVQPGPRKYSKRNATTKFTQFKMLLHRGWFSRIRNANDMKVQFFKSLATGLAVGAAFYQKANLSYPFYKIVRNDLVALPGVNSCCSLLFLCTLLNLANNLQAISYLCEQGQVYRREMASFAYSASPYWLAGCFTCLPILFGTHLLSTIIIYFLAGFPHDFSYFCYFFSVLFFVNVASYYTAQFLAARTGNAAVALAIFPITLFFLTMFSGYSIAVGDLPPGWTWAAYISYARWAFEGLLVTHFNRYNEINHSDISSANPGDQGQWVLSLYTMNGKSNTDTIWILLVTIHAIALLVYLSLRPRKSKLKKIETVENRETLFRPSLLVDGYLDAHAATITTFDYIVRMSFNIGDINFQEEDDDNEQETIEVTFQPRQSLDVNWFRRQSEDVQRSKGCRLLFRDLYYSVKTATGVVEILKGISGQVQPGEMCALMGASGAGKSTLLDVLAGRKTVGKIEGNIYFNGGCHSSAVLRSSAYVMQDNVHLGALTVRQTLMYAAQLRIDYKCDQSYKDARVQKILDMLGLSEHAETLVGDEYLRGLSGGQLKRLSIGVEVVNLPDLIFLDEPTTGLDSTISHEVMSAVRNLANQNRTIICTIHQPSPDTFFLFDKLMLLGSGKVIYYGPVSDVVAYFVSSPWEFKYIQGANPADYVIAVAGSFINALNGSKVSSEDLAVYFSKTKTNRLFMESIDTTLLMDSMVGKSESSDLASNDYPAPTYYQLKILLERLLKTTLKQPRVVIAPFVRSMIIGTLLGSIYYKLPTGDKPDCYISRMSVLFFGLLTNFVGHQEVIPIMFYNRLLFYRERGAKIYGAIPYWFSTWVIRLPFVAVNSSVFCACIYTLCGLRSGGFSFFYLIVTTHSFVASFVCQLVAHVNSTAAIAISSMSVFFFLNIAFAGYIIFIDELDPWLGAWLPYISFFRYSFQALIRNEFDNNPDLPLGAVYIDNLGFESLTKETCFSLQILMLITYAVSGLLALKYLNFEER